jgi:hypothetical protein
MAIAKRIEDWVNTGTGIGPQAKNTTQVALGEDFGVILVVMQREQSVLYRTTALPSGTLLLAIAGLGAIVFVADVFRSFGRKR